MCAVDRGSDPMRVDQASTVDQSTQTTFQVSDHFPGQWPEWDLRHTLAVPQRAAPLRCVAVKL